MEGQEDQGQHSLNAEGEMPELIVRVSRFNIMDLLTFKKSKPVCPMAITADDLEPESPDSEDEECKIIYDSIVRPTKTLSGGKKHLRSCKCKICKRTFSSRDQLISCSKKVNKVSETRKLKTKIVRSNKGRKGQPRGRGPGRPRKTPLETKKSKAEKTLNRHSKPQMRIKKVYQCTICKLIVKGPFALRTHLRVHNGERPYPCPFCQNRFARNYSRILHIRRHTGEKPFKCQLCGEQFHTKYSLFTHIGVHTNEKPYKCQLCEEWFSTGSSLRLHIRVHTKEKPFVCQVCGRTYKSELGLVYHYLRSPTHRGQKQ